MHHFDFGFEFKWMYSSRRTVSGFLLPAFPTAVSTARRRRTGLSLALVPGLVFRTRRLQPLGAARPPSPCPAFQTCCMLCSCGFRTSRVHSTAALSDTIFGQFQSTRICFPVFPWRGFSPPEIKSSALHLLWEGTALGCSLLFVKESFNTVHPFKCTVQCVLFTLF